MTRKPPGPLSVAAPAQGATMTVLLKETFSGSLNTPLASRPADIGGPYLTGAPGNAAGAYAGTTGQLLLVGNGYVMGDPANASRPTYFSIPPALTEYDITFNLKVLNTYGVFGICFRYDPVAGTAYVCEFSGAGNDLHIACFYDRGRAVDMGHYPIVSGGMVNGTVYPVIIKVRDAGITVIVNGVTIASAVNAGNNGNFGAFSYISGVTAAGTPTYIGLYVPGIAAAVSATQIANFQVSTPAGTLAAPTPYLIGTGPNGAALATPLPPDGTTPYTYQWHRSLVSGFTPNALTAIAGATAQTLTDSGLLSATNYYYKLVIKDAAGATVTTTQVAASTAASYAPNTLVVIKWGDSITANSGDGTIYSGVLSGLMGGRPVVCINRGISSTWSENWLPYDASNMLRDVVLFAKVIGATYLSEMIGTNNTTAQTAPTSGAAFYGDMVAICKYILSAGYTPVLNAPIFRGDNTALLNYLYQYGAQKVLLASSLKGVLLGNTTGYADFQSNFAVNGNGGGSSYFVGGDNLHPAAGYPELNTLWATDLYNAITRINAAVPIADYSTIPGGLPVNIRF